MGSLKPGLDGQCHRLSNIDHDELKAICSVDGAVNIHKHSQLTVNGLPHYYCAVKEEARLRIRRRRRNLKLMGVSAEEYENLLETQNELCAICLRPETATRNGKVRLLNIDHDHTTGKIRGLLCSSCNISIGMMEDSPSRLRAAAKYLEVHGA